MTSALSQFNFAVDGLEFYPSIVDLHLPVHAALSVVDIVAPCRDFPLKSFDITDATFTHALASQRVKELSSFSAMFSQLPCFGV